MSAADAGNADHVDHIGIVRRTRRRHIAGEFPDHLRERRAARDDQQRATRVLVQRPRGNRPSFGGVEYYRGTVQSLDEWSCRLFRPAVVTLVDAIEPHGPALVVTEHVGETFGARFALGRDWRIIDGARCFLHRTHQKHHGRGGSVVESPAEREEYRCSQHTQVQRDEERTSMPRDARRLHTAIIRRVDHGISICCCASRARGRAFWRAAR